MGQTLIKMKQPDITMRGNAVQGEEWPACVKGPRKRATRRRHPCASPRLRRIQTARVP